jgi:hypothetical protein
MNKLFIKILILLLSVGFSAEFVRTGNGPNFTRINFNLGELTFDKNSNQILNIDSSGLDSNESNTISTSFYYQYNGEIDFNINSFEYEIINGNFPQIPQPEIQILSAGKMRGFNFFKLTINPIFINNDKSIIFTYIDFTILENETTIELDIETRINSKVFDNLANQLAINSTRNSETNYQNPAILYITGGASGSNPNFQSLLNWRKKRGYKVYEISTDQIGGSSVNDIKSYIQMAYEEFNPAPEFVCLVGDDGGDFNIDSFTEFYSGYNGEGDHPYSQLSGNDLLPEVIIGRISIRTFDHINTIIQKILYYEKAVYLDSPLIDNNWIERTALVADPTQSGNSTIITNNYIKETMEIAGIENVQLNYGEYDYSSWMVEKINSGISYLNYRGWWGVSGFNINDVNSLSNGPMLPFATMITCGTGSFAFDETSMSEALLRSGTVSLPKGAIASVGTATSGTHTAYNNIIDMGIYNGIFVENGNTTGEALALGKIALLKTYPNDPNDKVTIFSHWNNLMGDPAISLWTDTPKQIQLNLPEELNLGSHSYELFVTDELNNPIKNARLVMILNNDFEILNDLTDENGRIIANITAGYGDIEITITGKNLVPYEAQVTINNEQSGIYLNLENVIIIDDIGNNNQIINPGEQILIDFSCVNIGSINTESFITTITTEHLELEIIQGELNNLSIPPYSQSTIGPFEFRISNNVFHNEEIPLNIQIVDENNNTWNSTYNLKIEGYHPQISLNTNFSILHQGDYLYDFNFNIENKGILPINNLKAKILYNGSDLGISNNIINLGNINPNEIIESNQFEFYVSEFVENASYYNIPVRLFNENGYNQIEYLFIQIGEIESTDPVGPDNYGYYIIGSEDVESNLAPEYLWHEIDPYYEGLGENLFIVDNGDGNPLTGSSSIVDLPFSFKYYGEDYNNITVSSNGWISFGESTLTSFRNYPIPGSGGPSPMVAGFWDDLKALNSECEVGYVYDCSNDWDCCPIEWIGDGWPDCESQEYGCDLTCFLNDSGDCDEGHEIPVGSTKNLNLYQEYIRNGFGGAVLSFYDEGQNRFIIEWSDMRTFFQNDEEDFQIILYPKEGIDGDILINYKTFNNTSVGDYEASIPLHGQYSTIGIENKYQNDGLQYSYNNIYAYGAESITNGSSILITTEYQPIIIIDGDVNFDNNLNVADIVILVSVIMGTMETTNEINDIGDMNGDIIVNVNDIVQIIFEIIYN